MKPVVLDLRAVTLRRDSTVVLDGIDLTVHAGEHWAMLGPNGAGKSTILGLCGAQIHPTTGTVDVLGHRLGRVDLQELRRRIGHVNPRHPLRSPLSVHEVVLTGITGTIEIPLRWQPTPAEQQRADRLIERLGLRERRDARWPTLSQGERGRALIARALAGQPELLLLDEPATGLDVAAREQLLSTIDRLRRDEPALSSVLVTHHLEELPATTTHALVLAEGRTIASGSIEDAVTTSTVTAAFGHPICVRQEDGRWSARARADEGVA